LIEQSRILDVMVAEKAVADLPVPTRLKTVQAANARTPDLNSSS